MRIASHSLLVRHAVTHQGGPVWLGTEVRGVDMPLAVLAELAAPAHRIFQPVRVVDEIGGHRSDRAQATCGGVDPSRSRLSDGRDPEPAPHGTDQGILLMLHPG